MIFDLIWFDILVAPTHKRRLHAVRAEVFNAVHVSEKPASERGNCMTPSMTWGHRWCRWPAEGSVDNFGSVIGSIAAVEHHLDEIN